MRKRSSLCASEAAASSAPPCRKFDKTCTPPDDDVISYGSDLNIITKGGEPATRYVRADTHTHTQGREEGVCEQANHSQQRGRTDRLEMHSGPL